MVISKRYAEEIIENLRSVVHEDINFMTPDGYIIASSDKSRIGDYHEGATIVARTNKLLIIDKHNQYEGTKKGINLPICIEQNVVAIIGITGEANDILQFSNVIVKMSEILIKEHLLNIQKQFKRENNRVILELITKGKVRTELITYKMNELGYDAGDFGFFLVCDLSHFDSKNIELSNMIYNSIEKRVNYKDLVARFQSKFYILTQQKDYNKLIKKIEPIKNYVENKYKVSMTIGISESINSVHKFSSAFLQADTVVELGVNKGSGKIKQFDPSSLEFLFHGFSSYITKDFSNSVLEDIDDKDKTDIKAMISSYIRNNGSITKASEELFIHKNTFQYRLNKIWEKTGYNPRNLEDLIILYIALELDSKKMYSNK